MPPSPAISPALTTATDTLLMRAMDALEAAGADFDGQAPSKHALVMPGRHLRQVNQALSDWHLLSCAQGSCESWTQPVAQAAQQVFQAIDAMFEQARRLVDTADEARIPFLVSGTQIRRLTESGQHWAQTPRPRIRCALR